MGLSLMGVVHVVGSFNLKQIVECAAACLVLRAADSSGFVVFLVAGLAETRRLPFDLPEAESELVAGYPLRILGHEVRHVFRRRIPRHHADFGAHYDAIFRRLARAGVAADCLVPVENFAFICLFILLRAALPRPRFDQLMAWGWKVLLPLALLNLVVTAVNVCWQTARDEDAMLSLLKAVWYVSAAHVSSARHRAISRGKGVRLHPVFGAGSSSRATPTAASDAWPVTCAPSPVRWTALPCRRPKTNTDDGIRSFSASIFHAVFFADTARKPVRPTRSSSRRTSR